MRARGGTNRHGSIGVRRFDFDLPAVPGDGVVPGRGVGNQSEVDNSASAAASPMEPTRCPSRGNLLPGCISPNSATIR